MSSEIVKSNKIAEKLRKQGFDSMQNGEIYEAILKFNESLCNAESDTKIMRTIYANRAETYFKLKIYDKCLNNIQLARDQNCLPDKMKSLDDLQEKCLEEFNEDQTTNENPWDFFKLSYPANKRLPFVADCLEVKCDNKYGRHVITNKPLKVGDILAIEEPFFKIVKSDPEDNEYPMANIYVYCAYCLNDNLMDLIPCTECLTTMFCSTRCQQEANKSFHKYECNYLEFLNNTGNWRMPLRNFFHSLSICDDSIEELEKLMIESDSESPTVYNYAMDDQRDPDTVKNHLKCMIGLARRVVVTVRNFSEFFTHHPLLSSAWCTHQEFIKKFLKRMMQIEILNFHGIKGRSLDRNNPYRSSVGDGGYAFCSLLNHSCCSNVMRIVVENRMVVIVERPIKKGEQIFDCYIGDSFYFKTKNSRHMELMDYQFICDCEACTYDFPELLTGALQACDKTLLHYAQQAYNELRNPKKKLTPMEARELALKYSKIMQRCYRENNYPCREIVLLELCTVKCFLMASKSNISFP
ncbi:CLUMA_CG003123, isoform A [Clunio marinus]|uniref:CLUMA_CG003123, isoform A n=1 Tax=Clunio marinus TaxID=568069 RepID=A0A1J1HMT6_9DIPT|nr:CLUMA_CG003123, isoform A [Clunio marinus]